MERFNFAEGSRGQRPMAKTQNIFSDEKEYLQKTTREIQRKLNLRELRNASNSQRAPRVAKQQLANRLSRGRGSNQRLADENPKNTYANGWNTERENLKIFKSRKSQRALQVSRSDRKDYRRKKFERKIQDLKNWIEDSNNQLLMLDTKRKILLHEFSKPSNSGENLMPESGPDFMEKLKQKHKWARDFDRSSKKSKSSLSTRLKREKHKSKILNFY